MKNSEEKIECKSEQLTLKERKIPNYNKQRDNEPQKPQQTDQEAINQIVDIIEK